MISVHEKASATPKRSAVLRSECAVRHDLLGCRVRRAEQRPVKPLRFQEAWRLGVGGIQRLELWEERVLEGPREIRSRLNSVMKTQPVTIYAGTSLTTDTMLEKKWLESSQGLWIMRCGCGQENIPLPELKLLHRQ
jgi:hypothetical protein